jgi:ribonuclease HI
MSLISVYSDGSCYHNQKSRGSGGFGYVIIKDGVALENSGFIRNKTANEMEMIAIISALKDVMKLVETPSRFGVQIFTDSNYIIQNWQNNLVRWVSDGWLTKKGKDVANREYWQLLLETSHRIGFLSVKWCDDKKANKYHERAHKLAKEAASNGQYKVSKKQESNK